MKNSVKQDSKSVARPFGLELLETVSEAMLEEVSGGRGFQTEYISLASKGHPHGDRG